eukprot:635211-Pleurochrysis_carterae.AAC.1
MHTFTVIFLQGCWYARAYACKDAHIFSGMHARMLVMLTCRSYVHRHMLSHAPCMMGACAPRTRQGMLSRAQLRDARTLARSHVSFFALSGL